VSIRERFLDSEGRLTASGLKVDRRPVAIGVYQGEMPGQAKEKGQEKYREWQKTGNWTAIARDAKLCQA